MTSKLYKISFFAIFFLLAPVLHISGQSHSDDPWLRTIVIDPGHGGKDPGAPGPDSKRCEKNIVLKISKLFGEKIKEAYPLVKVVYTRNGDSYPTLTDRVKTAHECSADLFISIHCNSNKSSSASGTSTHILARRDSRNPNRDLFDESVELTKLENSVFEIEEEQGGGPDSVEDQILHSLLFHANFDHSVMFAQMVVDELATKPFHKWGKGIHQNDFLLLKKMTCPAILVECGFLSNPTERKLLVSDKWQEEIAERLFAAFKEYKTKYDASVTSPDEEAPAKETARPAASGGISAEPDSDTYYSVQIMGLKRLLDEGDPAFKGLKPMAVKGEDSSIYKYLCGKYSTKSEADAKLPAIRKKFSQAFVVKVENGKISIPK